MRQRDGIKELESKAFCTYLRHAISISDARLNGPTWKVLLWSREFNKVVPVGINVSEEA